MIAHFLTLHIAPFIRGYCTHSPCDGNLCSLSFINREEAGMSIPGESVEWTYAFSSFGKIPGSVTAGLYDESVFSVIINHQTVFQIIYIISGSHQQ